MDWSKLVEGILPALTTIAYMLAARYGLELVGWLMEAAIEGIDRIQAKINTNKYAKMAQFDDWIMDRLGEIVLATKDTLVDALKKKSKDGKLTADEAKEVTSLAFKSFKDSLSDIELNTVVKMLGKDFRKIVLNRIPSVVSLLKLNGKESKPDQENSSSQDPTLKAVQ